MKSINAPKLATENVPLPLKFILEEGPSSTPSTVLYARNSRSKDKTILVVQYLHTVTTTTHIPLVYDWLALMDRSVAYSPESHFRAHVASVAERLEISDLVAEGIDEVDREIGGMMKWMWVSEIGLCR